jgi:hypothetical protein
MKGERNRLIFSIKKVIGKLQCYPITKICKIRVSIVDQFLVFLMRFSLNIGKGTILGSLMGVLLVPAYSGVVKISL